ncbi:dihydrofolate reductase [Lutimonas zeaxanthinifaciens]|uniref:dihydrofolate reductase n=1 Tax=Lutimonas zeaxanthinifaciens TaxID=3060215 RepID=UPI00265CB941|nr:dihydrofolate reductase [Lutimonas sp. YSD2104]WKK65448.1 dihydrofolate reductase [Lutimonas sp. YSD2104]
MLTIIAAVAKNNALGKNNDLIWRLPADLKRFKKITRGHHVIMGRKTFESLGKPLPHRTTIIITRNPDYTAEGCIVVDSLEKAILEAKSDDNPYILGGGEIYKQALDYADVMDITEVHHSFDEADAFFPEIDFSKWEEVKREDHKADEHHKYDYSFVTYKKK